MRTLRPVLAVVLALTLVGFVSAQGKSKELIVGKWEYTEKKDGKENKITMDFAKDGKLKVAFAIDGMQLFNIDGTYAVPDDKTLEVTFMGKTEKSKIEVSEKELSITGQDGKNFKMTRAK
jgi:uncharacterized protein (TIGR03066 family)